MDDKQVCFPLFPNFLTVAIGKAPISGTTFFNYGVSQGSKKNNSIWNKLMRNSFSFHSIGRSVALELEKMETASTYNV